MSRRGGNETVDRRVAAAAAAPLLAVGIGNVALVLLWGADPVWAFVLFPPVVFITALAWFAFRGGS